PLDSVRARCVTLFRLLVFFAFRLKKALVEIESSRDRDQFFYREASLASILPFICDHVLPGPLCGIPSERVEPWSHRVVEFEPNRVVLPHSDSWNRLRGHAERVEKMQNIFTSFLVVSDQIESFVVGVSSLAN